MSRGERRKKSKRNSKSINIHVISFLAFEPKSHDDLRLSLFLLFSLSLWLNSDYWIEFIYNKAYFWQIRVSSSMIPILFMKFLGLSLRDDDDGSNIDGNLMLLRDCGLSSSVFSFKFDVWKLSRNLSFPMSRETTHKPLEGGVRERAEITRITRKKINFNSISTPWNYTFLLMREKGRKYVR